MSFWGVSGLIGIGFVLAAAACGSSSTGNTAAELDCGFTACGGDVVGNWQVLKACSNTITDPDPSAPCKGISAQLLPDVDIALAFKADGSATSHMNRAPTVRATYTNQCLALVAQAGKQCADLATEMGGSGLAVTCNGDVKTSCACDIKFADSAGDSTSTYTVSGNVLETVSADGSRSSAPYCVTGSTLRVQSEAEANAVYSYAALPFSGRQALPLSVVQVAVKK